MIKEFKNEYKWLSNFAAVDIEIKGIAYPSVEHAYQSMKSNLIWWKNFCSDIANTAGQVKKKSREIELRTGWEDMKLKAMRYCLDQKYSKAPYKGRLLATGNKQLQEGNYWGDKFYGVCLKTGEGENNMGKMIMDIRKKLDEER